VPRQGISLDQSRGGTAPSAIRERRARRSVSISGSFSVSGSPPRASAAATRATGGAPGRAAPEPLPDCLDSCRQRRARQRGEHPLAGPAVASGRPSRAMIPRLGYVRLLGGRCDSQRALAWSFSELLDAPRGLARQASALPKVASRTIQWPELIARDALKATRRTRAATTLARPIPRRCRTR
jgi:hypothetical protein